MTINIAIESKLIEEAKILGNHKTVKDTVTEALIEYIARHKQAEIIDLFGKIDYYSNYDYKKQRGKI